MSPVYCSLRCGSAIVDIKEDDDWVYCTYHNVDGKDHKVRARYLVGADGKTGYTRKQYLEPRGVMMEKFHESVARLFLAEGRFSPSNIELSTRRHG